MPILNADKAKNVIVIKRGQGAGFSGIENALFYLDHTRMLYGDGQAKVAERRAGRQTALSATTAGAVGRRHPGRHAASVAASAVREVSAAAPA